MLGEAWPETRSTVSAPFRRNSANGGREDVGQFGYEAIQVQGQSIKYPASNDSP